jgi:uncharacterized protein
MSDLDRMQRLFDPPCLSFPFRVGDAKPDASLRGAHVREQIEQALFTTPGERVFRPEFGAGIKALVFEPNSTPLWDLTRRRIQIALTEVLRGEVDPSSVEINVTGENERLEVVVRYRLLTIGVTQIQRFQMGGGSNG